MSHESSAASTSITDEVAALRAEVAVLRGELERLRTADVDVADGGVAASEADGSALAVTSRRRLFALAGGAAAAATVAAVAGSARPAAALNGAPINIATTATSTAAMPVVTTFVDYSGSSTTSGQSLFVVGDAAAATGSTAAAVKGYASKHVGVGVLGVSSFGNPLSVGVSGSSSSPLGVGVLGNSPNIAVYGLSTGSTATSAGVTGAASDGYGVVAASANNIDLWARGTGRFLMDAAVAAGPPTVGTFVAGELVRDDNFVFWVCTVGGAASQWRKLVPDPVVPAPLPPQLHVIEPTRVYDSRLPGFGGPINDAEMRQLSVANGIDLGTGAVTVANVVPVGATAIQFTFTIDAATNNGFLAVTPGDSTTFKASTINWSPTTPNIATGSLVKLDAVRNVRVFAGGGGSTQFLIDITGYYL
jgi:hypothetical protein